MRRVDLPQPVEPMVENAIRHGLAKGGTVRISTRNEDGDIVITVCDDGMGFTDQGTDKEKACTGAGIENVRTRLETTCSGSLDIKSDPGGSRKLKKAFENLRKPFLDVPESLYAKHYLGGDVIGSKLKKLREQRGISRQEIGDIIELDH